MPYDNPCIQGNTRKWHLTALWHDCKTQWYQIWTVVMSQFLSFIFSLYRTVSRRTLCCLVHTVCRIFFITIWQYKGDCHTWAEQKHSTVHMKFGSVTQTVQWSRNYISRHSTLRVTLLPPWRYWFHIHRNLVCVLFFFNFRVFITNKASILATYLNDILKRNWQNMYCFIDTQSYMAMTAHTKPTACLKLVLALLSDTTISINWHFVNQCTS